MILVGTSGYNYPEWRGSFYPEGFPTDKMLAYYCEHFVTVEINYSFYRLPTEKTVTEWGKTAPDGFTFTLKAPRRISHDARLKLEECGDLLTVFGERARLLGPKLGTLLFQLAPSFRKNVERLGSFLAALPGDLRAAFEFRHQSWLSDDVYDLLRAHNAALCITDTDEYSTPLVATARHGYFRLRDEGYEPDDIAKWARTVREMESQWEDVFVYFKHEEAGKGPEFANILLRLAGAKHPGPEPTGA